MVEIVDFTTLPSPKFYGVFYKSWGYSNEEQMPMTDGKWTKERDFDKDIDHLYPREHIKTLNADSYMAYKGKEILQDPFVNHKMHPIEVVISETVVREMHEHSLFVCQDEEGNADPKSRKETGGFLGGKLMEDDSGRCWIHILETVHDDPIATGEKDTLTIGIEEKAAWNSRIKKAGLINVGFWHSHPTYSPFQSDERFNGGADAQTTFDFCKSWWKVALVIDPFCGGNSQKNSTQLGAYKIVNPGMMKSFLTESDEDLMGWRSVGFAVAVGED